jgi:hypothetical protein
MFVSRLRYLALVSVNVSRCHSSSSLTVCGMNIYFLSQWLIQRG